MHRYPAEGGQPPPALIPHTAETGTACRHPVPLPIPLAVVSAGVPEHPSSVRLARVAGTAVPATAATAWLRVVWPSAIGLIAEPPTDAALVPA